MTDETRIIKRGHPLTTPRAAAVAGIIAGLLFCAVNLLMRFSLPTAPSATFYYSADKVGLITLTMRLVPFAGIFFLWFMGVARDRLGEWEDKFFATVFLGSGLLYLAMTFIAASLGAGILESYPRLEPALGDAIFKFTEAAIRQIVYIYGARMAAVFMISTATMWYRTTVMPRWLALLTYALGIGLLVLINYNLWVTLAFPAWMLTVSILILIFNYRNTPESRVEPGMANP